MHVVDLFYQSSMTNHCPAVIVYSQAVCPILSFSMIDEHLGRDMSVFLFLKGKIKVVS